MAAETSSFFDSNIDFSPAERGLFLDELTAAARDHKTVLGGGEPAAATSAEQRLRESIALLAQESAEFSPVLEVISLNERQMGSGKSSPELMELSKRFHFHLINIPVTLVPKPGWGFTQMECSIELNPGRAADERPVAHEIFPKEEWQDMIRASQGLSVGLDEELEFKLDSAEVIPENIPGVGGSAAAKARLQAKAGLVIGPFEYRIRRPRILSRGRHNVKIYWRLEGEAQFEREEPRLGIVMKTPKTVRHVDVAGALCVAKTFHTFTADLKVLLKYVRERTRHFFEQGAPLTAQMQWTDITK
jgi:hypothetical protein